MRVLFDHPGRPKWRLRRLTGGDKAGQVITGSYHHLRYQRLDRRDPFEEIPVWVGEGALTLVEHRRSYQGNFELLLQDRDDGVIYEAGGRSAMDFLLAVQAGRIWGEGGALRGRFTFAKRGQEVHIVPWMPDAAAEAQTDAAIAAAPALPDASALVARLPPPRLRRF